MNILYSSLCKFHNYPDVFDLIQTLVLRKYYDSSGKVSYLLIKRSHCDKTVKHWQCIEMTKLTVIEEDNWYSRHYTSQSILIGRRERRHIHLEYWVARILKNEETMLERPAAMLGWNKCKMTLDLQTDLLNASSTMGEWGNDWVVYNGMFRSW